MKANRLKWMFSMMILLTVGCQQMDENTMEFETLTESKTVYLTTEEMSPSCKVSLKLQSATERNGHRGELINNTVAERLFNTQDVSIKTAGKRFVEDYTRTYRQTMLPLYNQDRNDSAKHAWYEFHYVVETETQQGSKGTVAYIATVDYYEGGAHGIHQQIVMNFEAKTGRLLTLSDIFAEGSEPQLNAILQKALIENKGVASLSALKEKGFLVSVDIYAPENFIIGDETITFIYNPSEIAPYTAGATELIIPYTSLENILKNSFSTFII